MKTKVKALKVVKRPKLVARRFKCYADYKDAREGHLATMLSQSNRYKWFNTFCRLWGSERNILKLQHKVELLEKEIEVMRQNKFSL